MTKRWLAMALTLGLLAGCGIFKDKDEEADNRPPEVVYADGLAAMKEERYKTASKFFQDVDQKHPFSAEATKAQLNLIYSHYKNDEYEETVSSAERFVRLHPRHPHVAYAYYMRGLAFYRQILDAYHDQKRTREAMGAFREVISRFPKSDFAWDAERMIKLCRDRMAEQEMVVARYYLDREDYIAATNRFRRVVEDKEFSTTPYVEEALFSLALTSIKLGLTQEAHNYAAVLGHNYPEGAFYHKASEMINGSGKISKTELAGLRRGVEEGSWVTRFLDGLTPGVPGLTK